MRLHIILRYVGIILLLNAAFLFLSAAISFFNKDSGFLPLAYTCLISALFGAFPFVFVPPAKEIASKEGFAILVSSWLLACLFGMIPYVLWGGEFTITNSWFESVSGFTTTGSSILSDIEALPKGLLFWRSATHWIGGVGIIIFALSIMPSMGKVGMALYRTEITPLAAVNFSYQTRKTLKVIMYVYVGLTVMETVALMFCGMTLFDAVTHSFATIATGGFSTKNLSVAHYKSVAVEIAVSENVRALFKSTVFRFYLIMLLLGVFFTTINIHGTIFANWAESLRYASFQIISIGTSTGFATTNTNLWPPFAQLLILFFTLQCACSGSTSGGIKVDHLVVDEDVLEASLLFTLLYVIIVFFSSLLLCSMGVDIMTAFSASAATMGNVGPGFGLVSSVSNFNQIPELGKWILTGDMLLGRLEIYGIFLFVLMKFWK
jgi:trk system potassium uptake protein TrkH